MVISIVETQVVMVQVIQSTAVQMVDLTGPSTYFQHKILELPIHGILKRSLSLLMNLIICMLPG